MRDKCSENIMTQNVIIRSVTLSLQHLLCEIIQCT